MGETLAETRVEVEAQRADVEQTVGRLRDRVKRALDLRAKLQTNPLLYGGLAAGAAFLVVGGPRRLLHAARRRATPTRGEQAYDALPRAMQRWVDAVAGGAGSHGGDARRLLSEELQRWRHEPLSRKQARALAKAASEGPPGPSRTVWRVLETVATMASAAIARRAIERFLSGDLPYEAAAEVSPAHASGPSTGAPRGEAYAGWSARDGTTGAAAG